MVVMPTTRRAWSRWVSCATCLVLGVPIVVELVRSPRLRPFGYVAADAFYYLSVGRNIVEHGSASTDGQHATNGFHPIWQLIVAVTYGICRACRCVDYSVLAVVLASLGCALAALWILGRAIALAMSELPCLYVAVPFGLYACSILPYWTTARDRLEEGGEGPRPLYGTLYSFVNGMESSLAILAFASLAWAFVRWEGSRTARGGAMCGGALAFLCLARLDHGAFALFPSSIWVCELLASRVRRRFAATALLSFAMPLALYVVVNELYAGSAVPVSGAYKSSFPLPNAGTVGEALELFKHPPSEQSLIRVFRMAPSVFPALWTLAYVAAVVRMKVGWRSVGLEMRPFSTRFDIFLVKMGPGVLVLSAYNLLFLAYGEIGHWYQPVSTLYMSLGFLSLWAAATKRLFGSAGSWRAAAVAGLGALVVAGFVRYHRTLDYHRKFAEFFWREAPQVRAAFGADPPNLLEVDDGIVGFSLRAPAMSGLRLALDREGMAAAQAGHLTEVALARGNNAVASLFYGPHDLKPDSTERQARAWARARLGENLEGYRASVLYASESFTMVGLAEPPR